MLYDFHLTVSPAIALLFAPAKFNHVATCWQQGEKLPSSNSHLIQRGELVHWQNWTRAIIEATSLTHINVKLKLTWNDF